MEKDENILKFDNIPEESESCFYAQDNIGEIIFQISPQGKITLGENVELDYAAKVFWNCLVKINPITKQDIPFPEVEQGNGQAD